MNSISSNPSKIRHRPLAAFKHTTLAPDPSTSSAEILAQAPSMDVALEGTRSDRALSKLSQTIPSIPFDILSHIFQIHKALHPDARWGDNVPCSIRVSHVSRAWRDTALSTPSLWTSLVSSPTHSTPFYHMLIRRSKGLLLDFVVIASTHGCKEPARRLAALVPSQAHRLRTLQIQAPLDFIRRQIPALAKLAAPFMTEFKINQWPLTTDPLSDIPPVRHILTGGVCRLVTFQARNTGLRLQPPLASVRNMMLLFDTPVPYTALHEALKVASQTVSRLAVNADIICGAYLHFPCITMPFLTSLVFHGTPSDAVLFLAKIQAPSLETLSIVLWEPPSSEMGPRRHDSIAQNYPSLHTLIIYGVLARVVLTLLPNITRLLIPTPSRHTTNLGDMFDVTDPADTAMAPCLLDITASSLFKQRIEAFCSARRELGISVPVFHAIESRGIGDGTGQNSTRRTLRTIGIY